MTTEIVEIKNSGKRISIVATGGGSRFLYEFTKDGGASKVLVNFDFPYSCEEVSKYIESGNEKIKYNSEKTARRLAVASYYKHKCDFAIGITASLYVEGQREGRENCAYMAIYNEEIVYVKKIFLNGSRYNQEFALSDYIIEFIYQFLQGNIRGESNKQNPNWWKLICRNDLIYSGSFNPAHEGHRTIIDFCHSILDFDNLWIDICRNNFKKPKIDGIEVMQRADQFPNEFKCYTESPTLLGKAKEIGKPITFVIGQDILEFISHEDQDQLAKMGCKFLIFKRLINKEYKVGPYLNPGLRHPLQEVVDNQFVQVDISSSKIRENE